MRCILAIGTIAATLFPATGVLADVGVDFDLAAVCASVYQPVCGRKNSESRDFANACLARKAGFDTTTEGSCSGAGRPSLKETLRGQSDGAQEQ